MSSKPSILVLTNLLEDQPEMIIIIKHNYLYSPYFPNKEV